LEKPKDGFDTGLRVRHRSILELPVYVANFIMMDYGTSAIFGLTARPARL
jgi:leucyl-tRNA synthetase